MMINIPVHIIMMIGEFVLMSILVLPIMKICMVLTNVNCCVSLCGISSLIIISHLFYFILERLYEQ